MKKKQLLVLVLAMACIATISITATLAYLQDTDVVTNTFTVGKVDISLDEAEVDDEGQAADDAERVQANSYKLYPGKEYDKDPTVHVADGVDVEDCWLFVTVANGIAAIEDSANTIAAQMEDNGWTELVNYPGIFAYKEIVSAGDDVVVFENFKIAGTVDNNTLAGYKNVQIVVNAYAVQAEGFDTAAAAWQAANAAFNIQ